MHTFTPPAPLALDSDTPQTLERDLPSEGVLSVVLEVNPASSLNAGGALSLRARNLLNALKAPEVLVQSVLSNLEDAQRSTRTRAYFLWEEHGHVKALLVDAQLELPESGRFGAPDLEPLLYALESGSRTAIVLVDSEWARIFGVHLGVIRELYRLENVLELGNTFREHAPSGAAQAQLEDTDPHRDPGRRLLSRDTDNDGLERKQEHQDHLFYHALTEQLLHLHGVGAFERLMVAGPVRARATFKAQLPTSLERALSGEFALTGDASAHAVLEAAQSTLIRAESAAEAALLSEARERGVRGLSETLEAAQQGRVYQLLVAGDGSNQQVWQDSTGHLYGAYPDGGQSPLDGLAVQQKYLSEVLRELRVRYGLQVRFLRLEQAHILETELGGLAGLSRY